MKSIFLFAAVLLSATVSANPKLGSGKVGRMAGRVKQGVRNFFHRRDKSQFQTIQPASSAGPALTPQPSGDEQITPYA
jgi:hypothetical protein